MLTRTWLVGLLAVITLSSASPAPAEITSLGGATSVSIQEFRNGQAGATDQSSKTFPGTGVTLPLQVIARLADTDEQAAGSVAAQFEDPNTAPGPNPEEFAFNLALDSLAPDIYYTAQTSTEEIRGVQFTPAEVGGIPDGQRVRLTGRVFIDGALAIFAVPEATDLTGAQITFRVTIVQQTAGQADQQVFTGAVTVTGGPNRQINHAVEGAFPTSGIVDTDLAALDPQLGVFHVFILPNVIIDYPYEAVVGQPFTLHATISAEAANRPNGVGVAAVLGTPLNTVQDVLQLIQGQTLALKMTTALQQERAAPTGTPTFPPTNPLALLFPSCGLLGVESVLGAIGIAMLGRVMRPWRQRAKVIR